jgi:uncharacterized protein YjiS (DUF1127 family)
MTVIKEAAYSISAGHEFRSAWKNVRPLWGLAFDAYALCCATAEYSRLLLRHRKIRRELLSLDIEQLTDAGISEEALAAALKLPAWGQRL